MFSSKLIIRKSPDDKDCRVIRTARTELEINNAAQEGYFPLIRPVSPSPEICSKFAVFQHCETGEISVANDFRMRFGPGKKYKKVIDFTFYYPYSFASPFAAYLIPPDLRVGETVILEDLIEDLVSGRWNQGDVYRLKSCKARWDGKDFILHYSEKSVDRIIGWVRSR